MASIPILILAHPDDRVALRVYAWLRKRHGRGTVEIVSDEELVFARRWHHHIDSEDVRTEIELARGIRLDSDEIGVVLNRLRLVDRGHFAGAREADGQYAVMETHAMWLSWLASLPCPVVNPATPRGLCGPDRGEAEWLHLAGRAGLLTRGWHLSTNARRFGNRDDVPYPVSLGWDEREAPGLRPRMLQREPSLFLEPVEDGRSCMTVAGDSVVGPLAGMWDQELRALSEASRCTLMQVGFALRSRGARDLPEDWRVCDASGFVQVDTDPVILAIGELLESRAAGGTP